MNKNSFHAAAIEIIEEDLERIYGKKKGFAILIFDDMSPDFEYITNSGAHVATERFKIAFDYMNRGNVFNYLKQENLS